MSDTIFIPTTAIQPVHRFGNPLARLATALVKLNQNYRHAQSLKSLSDHTLKDVGISRQAANREFYNRWQQRG